MSDPEDPGGGPLRHPVLLADEQDLPVDTAALERVARRALAWLGVPPATELSIGLVTPDAIAQLKARSFGEGAATDVLSFPMDGAGGPVLGDVVICPAVAARQARGLGRSLGDEMALLLVHGILHLLGRDHETPAGELAMRAEEQRVLAGVEVAS